MGGGNSGSDMEDANCDREGAGNMAAAKRGRRGAALADSSDEEVVGRCCAAAAGESPLLWV